MMVKLKRFYCPKESLEGSRGLLPEDEAAHLTRVLRLGVGAEVNVFDGEGSEYLARVVAVERRGVEIELLEPLKPCPEPPLRVILGLSLFARDRLRLTVQKAVELGANEIRLVRAQRSVRGVGLEKGGEKLEGLVKVAREAAKQCIRSVVPKIFPVETVPGFAAGLPQEALKLIFWEEARDPGLKEVLARHRDKKTLVGLVGPEGGFTRGEVELLKDHGFLVVAAGPRILRTETAAMFFLCAIQYEMGDMGFPLTS